VVVVGAVNYSWTTTDNSSSASGVIANGNTTANITGLPAGKTVFLSIEPANLRRFYINYVLVSPVPVQLLLLAEQTDNV